MPLKFSIKIKSVQPLEGKLIRDNLMLNAVADAKDEIAKEDVDEEANGDLAKKVFPQIAKQEEDDKGD